MTESSPGATESEELGNDPSALVGLEDAGGDCIAELLGEAKGETSGDATRDDTCELETPREEEATSELVTAPSEIDGTGGVTMPESDAEGLMTILESDKEEPISMLESDDEGPMFMLESDDEDLMSMLESDAEGLMTMLDSDEEESKITFVRLVKALLVVST